jgi:putative ABC transport system permease protein
MRVMTVIGQLQQDARYAVRVAARQPGTSLIIVLSLALGIGANTLVFSLVNGILLRAFPYPEPERLVMFWFTPPDRPEVRAGLANAGACMDLRLESTVYEHAGCYIGVEGNVADPADAQAAGPEWLTGEMLSYRSAMAVGTRPMMGRWFTQDEDNADADRVMLISFDLWQRRFGGAPDVLGKRLRVADFGGNVDPSTIIGVMPANFSFANPRSDYFVPLRPTNRLRNSPARNRWVVARLKPGITLEQAQEGANQFAANLERDSPRNKGWGIKVEPVSESQVGFLRAPFQMLQGAAALVLLIACANVGGLLLAQGITRQRELVVRAAIGSGRWRIVRQLLTESVALSLLGALVSIIVIAFGINALLQWLPAWIPRLNEVAIDDRVLLFTTVTSVLTSIVFGMLPALSASRLDLAAAFKASSRTGTASPGRLRLRSAFVVLQVSTAFVLVSGAGLLINSLMRLSNADIGFDPRNLTTFQMSFTGREFFGATGRTTPSGSTEMQLSPRINTVSTELRDRIAALPGVEGVAISNARPLAGGRLYAFAIAGRQPATSERDALRAAWHPIGADYFKVLQAPIVRGREFGDLDTASGAPVALVNETMARRYWPDEDPIGQTITVEFFNDRPRQIVGIVPDIRPSIRNREPEPRMYVPYAQLPQLQAGVTAFGLETVTFVVRSAAQVEDWLPQAQAAAVEIDPAHAVTSVQLVEDFAAQQTQGFRQYVILLGVFSAIALIMAVVGVYGVMSHSVTQRTSEIGIRVAFGATARNILAIVLSQGLTVIGLGLVVGLAASLAATRIISSSLYGITATDPATFTVVVLTLFVIACVACYVPARRALKVDPVVAMQHD